MAVDLVNMPLAEMLALQVELNNRVAEIKDEAYKDLMNNKPVKDFTLKKGKTSRFIKEPELYRGVLEDALGDNFGELCLETKVIALTKAETLVNKQFDKEDAKKIIGKLQHCTDTKTSLPTLVYSPSGV